MIYKILEIPYVYKVVQFILSIGGKKLIKEILSNNIGNQKYTGLMLDVGSGPSSKFADFGLDTIGLDISFEYISNLCKNHDSSKGVVASIDSVPLRANSFDAVFSLGLFHHVPDNIAKCGLAEILRVCKSGGQIIIMDAVLPEKKLKRPFASIIRKLDRGKYMRRQNDFQNLLPNSEKWEIQRITYNNITKVEMLISSYTKP